MDFLLFLHLGNDAMQTPEDLAQVLEKVARSIRAHEDQFKLGTATLTDTNGNTVGFYNLKESDHG